MYWSRVFKPPNSNGIQDNFQTKHFGKSHFQCNIGMYSPGSMKPSAELNITLNYDDKDDQWSGILSAA